MPRLHLPPFHPVTTRGDLPAHATEFLPDGADIVFTPELVELLAGAPVALRNRRLVVVDGQPGCGKSTALAVLAAASPIRTAVFTVPTNRSGHGRQFMERAHSAVAGRPVRNLSQREHENALGELLAEEPMLLFIDEAQNAPLEVLRNLRTLLEAPGAQFAVALFGTGVRANIAREPMLHTWRGFTKCLEPLLTPHQVMTAPAGRAADLARRSQLLPTLAGLHPRLATTPARLLIEANRVHAHGLLRQWTLLLEWLLDLHPGAGPFTREDLIAAITAIDNDPPAFAA
ncbi:AAA domain-containing protein [Blastococcus aggregatus]|uniref:AAA domain-containing protein n=1 Tax=Blastococcus aggregatus TaxID=38502 RepID=A0A285V0S8_9ACTN|nr:ATP-binding protein [Blastococcus aggregatus]SOC47218.1 AAA domain-containing protein [Blastococcus aggregatus]